jgi:hypothetical protein
MKTITKRAEHLRTFFKTKERDNGDTFVYTTDDRPQELQDAIYEAHEQQLPNDWIFGTFADLLQKVEEYDCENIEQLEDYRHEIVDSYVDIYTHDLTKWLHENQALSYLEDACDGFVSEDGAWQLLARAQYNAIDEVMRCVIDVLSKDV